MTAGSVEQLEPTTAGSAAELIACQVRGLLERRLAWLASEQGDSPDAEAVWQEVNGKTIEADAELEHHLQGPCGGTWTRLVELFQLSRAEADLLAVAVAVAAEPALGPLVGRAQGADGRFVPTEPLIKRLFGHSAKPIWRPTGPLATWGLVVPVKRSPGEPLGFEADPRITDWLFGSLSVDGQLVLAVSTVGLGSLPPEWPIFETARRLDAALQVGSEVRVLIEARAGSGRRAFAAAVAQQLDRESLLVDPAPLAQEQWPENFMRVQRFALFADAAVIWRESAPAWPDKIPFAPLQFVCVGEGETAPVCDASVDLSVRLPEPSVRTKAARCRTLMPHLAGEAGKLAATPGVSLGDLEEASRAAPQSYAEASEHLREKARARMQGAGRVVDPSFGWDDFVVPPDLTRQLQAIVFEARMRPALFENAETARIFARAAGLSALFSGPAGVGKSMAAQVIARDLGVNLLVVDLASTTSKYVGETAKNLSNTFARAQAAGAALIFEEADAFFARRTEVKDSNDRYANSDTNHLLQLLEAYDGLVILSTNRRANIDPAFIRRLRHVVEFPKPGPSERRRLWSLMLAALGVPVEPLSHAMDAMAQSHDLSPAQIKGAALTAWYAAMAEHRPVAAGDLEDAAALELTKEGRSVPIPNRRRLRSRQHG